MTWRSEIVTGGREVLTGKFQVLFINFVTLDITTSIRLYKSIHYLVSTSTRLSDGSKFNTS
jgi:hypothetical protein